MQLFRARGVLFYNVGESSGKAGERHRMAVRHLGEFEQLVLLAVARLEDRGYGVTLRQEIEERAGRRCSLGAVYATLDRLEAKGFVSSWEGEPTAERGGRAKRLFRLEPLGARALRKARETLDRMWDGLDDGLGLKPEGGAA